MVRSSSAINIVADQYYVVDVAYASFITNRINERVFWTSSHVWILCDIFDPAIDGNSIKMKCQRGCLSLYLSAREIVNNEARKHIVKQIRAVFRDESTDSAL
jgi:hypothetical protein